MTLRVNAESQLVAPMESYLERLEAGDAIDPDEFVKAYPEIADELRSLISGLRFLHSASPKLAHLDQDASAVPTNSETLGDFRLLHQIARGGMGAVYEAEQLSLKRRVAIKILPFAGMLNANQLQRFKNEALAAASLQHPNIVNAFFVGHERGVHFYAMRLIEGHSLAEIIFSLRESRVDQKRGEENKVSSAPDNAMNACRVSNDSLEADTIPIAALSTSSLVESAGSGDVEFAISPLGGLFTEPPSFFEKS